MVGVQKVQQADLPPDLTMDLLLEGLETTASVSRFLFLLRLFLFFLFFFFLLFLGGGGEDVVVAGEEVEEEVGRVVVSGSSLILIMALSVVVATVAREEVDGLEIFIFLGDLGRWRRFHQGIRALDLALVVVVAGLSVVVVVIVLAFSVVVEDLLHHFLLSAVDEVVRCAWWGR